ncbi:hypothetical protein [Peptostreptococcus russellii]|uniref:Uncharacterized protein n=1 Tax=Peptostreptococcus russellii TaxID=215200 RepID=A0A1H8KWA0_9FIRM|nr:hypothetical protein [Peptostreptococcus russellii]SEN97091.1 hypothetical protein SAMN05216454_14810 [Peptostreptococcus russellii]
MGTEKIKKTFDLLQELEQIKEEQKKDKATINYLLGFARGLEVRVSNLEHQEK